MPLGFRARSAITATHGRQQVCVVSFDSHKFRVAPQLRANRRKKLKLCHSHDLETTVNLIDKIPSALNDAAYHLLVKFFRR
jgi:hypothetical protein